MDKFAPDSPNQAPLEAIAGTAAADAPPAAKQAVDPQALACLMNYDWPGNVRELENVVRRAVAIGLTSTLTLADLPPKLVAVAPKPVGDGSYPADDSLAAYEMAAIQNALAKAEGKRRQAARLLQIGEATLYRKIGKYNLN
jgi:DNA-binding NtrC family response regulator